MSISIVSNLARHAQGVTGDAFRPAVADNDTLDFASALAQSTANVLAEVQTVSRLADADPLPRLPLDKTGQSGDEQQPGPAVDTTSDATLNLAASLATLVAIPPAVVAPPPAQPLPTVDTPPDQMPATVETTDATGRTIPAPIDTSSLPGSDPVPGKPLPSVAGSTTENTALANTALDPRRLPTDSRPAPNPVTVAGAEQAAKFAVAPTGEATAPADSHRQESPPALSGLATLETVGNRIHDLTAAPPEAPKELQTPLRDPAWNSEFGQKLLWFAHNDKQEAHLTLNPPQLGSIEITLNLDKDSASAYFASANPEVRNAIETAAPRLREMFAAAGIDLGQVGVGSESFREQPNNRQQQPSTHRQTADNAILDIDLASSLPTAGVTTRLGSARVDIFA